MTGAAGARETEQFATLLRELKDRSGLSYGALAKRLHMSTSTLHRYCHGTAVPSDYAPVERLARVCRATHRRNWWSCTGAGSWRTRHAGSEGKTRRPGGPRRPARGDAGDATGEPARRTAPRRTGRGRPER